MFYRRKILLSLLQLFKGKLPKIDFQKYLFLFNIKRAVPFFEFIPYKYGCYSFQANQDMLTLCKYNLVEDLNKNWKLVDKSNYLSSLKMEDRIALLNLNRDFKYLKEDDLIKYVYENYPYYAIHSLKAKEILNDESYKLIRDLKPNKNNYLLCTIGYEGKTIEHFTNQLIKEDIRVLCDIRKNALSMKYGFSKNQLKFILENVGIEYIHIPELGIESGKRQNLNTLEDYEELFRNYELDTLPGKLEELKTIHNLFIENKRIALMCFEADHKCCHRSRTLNALIKLNKKDYTIKHL